MFTWVTFYKEAAEQLRGFRNRQQELVALLVQMREAGFKSSPTLDCGADGKRFTFREIDPFSFLGNFNRQITAANRSGMWKILKREWELQSPLPTDYEGLPVFNNQNAWVIPWERDRDPANVPVLWDLFEHIMTLNATDDLDEELFDRATSFKGAGMAMVTMGFFWSRPEVWIATDRKNRAFAESRGIKLKPNDAGSYKRWMRELRQKIGGDMLEFSRQAHKWSLVAEQEAATSQDEDTTNYDTRPMWLLAPGEGGKFWQDWQRDNEGSIGWNEVGDLSALSDKEAIRTVLAERIPDSGRTIVGSMLHAFAHEMRPGDLVFAKEGLFGILGYGVVSGSYHYEPSRAGHQHVISIQWKDARPMQVPQGVQLPQITLSRIEDKAELVRAVMEFYELNSDGLPSTILREEPAAIVPSRPTPPPPYTLANALADLFMPQDKVERIIAQLRRKKNLILQGAPGTGKTFVARRLAYLLMGCKDESRAPMVQFHQSMSYEDFIQGYRPDGINGFTLRDGVFHRFCRDAMKRPGEPHVFIIDEINRGNLSKILGELMMLIEHDKRSSEHALPLAYATSREEKFFVPDNVYLIGTMNTADRSLSMVDYALRRRFTFVEMEPGFAHDAFVVTLARKGVSAAIAQRISSQMKEINRMIADDRINLGSGYRIGHSFFVPASDVNDADAWLLEVYEHEIVPLIHEYWVDDEAKRQKALAFLGLD